MSTETKCEICGENHLFEFPNGLVATALRGDLVVFAGAGVSTEARRVYPNTFAESIAHELALKRNERALPFPEIMSRYEERFGRRQLLQRIRSRLDYMEGFPELLDTAARFHKELATAHFMSDIATTNWDTLFEDYSAATPFVVPDDYAFWEVGRRKVFKLHGSMRNLGTIVATTRDYQRCYRRLRGGTIGATFKHMLATRSIVFIGYSFGDFDLNRLIAFVKREMGDVLPRSYLVTPHGYEGDDFPPDRVVRTDGTYFIERLKDAAIDLGFMRPDDIYSRATRLLTKVNGANQRVARKWNVKNHPPVIYTLAYQNGLQHAFSRILALRPSGHYSDPHSTHGVLHSYEQLRRQAIRKGNYFDAAYIDGYLNGLLILELDPGDIRHLPFYFVWRSDNELVEYDAFNEAMQHAEALHKAASRHAKRLVNDLAPGLLVRHKPFLDVTLDE